MRSTMWWRPIVSHERIGTQALIGRFHGLDHLRRERIRVLSGSLTLDMKVRIESPLMAVIGLLSTSL